MYLSAQGRTHVAGTRRSKCKCSEILPKGTGRIAQWVKHEEYEAIPRAHAKEPGIVVQAHNSSVGEQRHRDPWGSLLS